MRRLLAIVLVVPLLAPIRANGGGCGPTDLILLSGQISSPKHPPNDFYNANEFCEYRINVGPDANRRIIMNFTRFATEACLKVGPTRSENYGQESDNSDNCDWVKVFDGNTTKGRLIGRFSGVYDKPFVVETGDTAVVQFRSNANLQRSGFVMDYRTQYRGAHRSP